MKKQRQHQQETQMRNRQQSEKIAKRREKVRKKREKALQKEEERIQKARRKKKMKARKDKEKFLALEKKAAERAKREEEKEINRIRKSNKKRASRIKRKRATKALRKILKIVLCIVIVAGGIFSIVHFGFQMKSVEMTGNEIYSKQELMDYIFSDGKNKNTFIFWLQVKTGIHKKDIPFIEKYDVKMKSPSKLQFSVYEKSLIGYIEKEDLLLYFDREGIIEKITNTKIKGLPKVIGIEINNAKLYESLEVQEEKYFDLLLTVSQAVQKYDFNVKKIEVTQELETAIYIKKLKVDLGKGNDLNEKMIDLSDMIASGLLNYEGTVYMKELSTDGSGYTIKRNVENTESETQTPSDSEETTENNEEETASQ